MIARKTSRCISVMLGIYLLQASQNADAAESGSSFTTVTVLVNGPGHVTPNYNGHQLRIGSEISMTAVPAAGYIFAGWTGTGSTLHNPGFFDVIPELQLRADFIPNPFPALQ